MSGNDWVINLDLSWTLYKEEMHYCDDDEAASLLSGLIGLSLISVKKSSDSEMAEFLFEEDFVLHAYMNEDEDEDGEVYFGKK
ncbi:MAG: hypothetical protein ACRERR_00235 [Moraxellaceae bacterium]